MLVLVVVLHSSIRLTQSLQSMTNSTLIPSSVSSEQFSARPDSNKLKNIKKFSSTCHLLEDIYS